MVNIQIFKTPVNPILNSTHFENLDLWGCYGKHTDFQDASEPYTEFNYRLLVVYTEICASQVKCGMARARSTRLVNSYGAPLFFCWLQAVLKFSGPRCLKVFSPRQFKSFWPQQFKRFLAPDCLICFWLRLFKSFWPQTV